MMRVPILLRMLLVMVIVGLVSWAYLGLVPLEVSQTTLAGNLTSLEQQGLYPPEATPDGESFRWSSTASRVELQALGSGAHILNLRLSAPHPGQVDVPVTLQLNAGTPLTITLDEQVRDLSLLTSAEDVVIGDNELLITSATFSPTEYNSQSRQLGVVLFELGWERAAAVPWLLPLQILSIAGSAGLLWLLLVRAGIPSLPSLASVALYVVILIATRHSDTRFVYRWHAIIVSLGLGVCFGLGALLIRPGSPERLAPVRDWLRLHWAAFVGYLGVTLLMLAPMLPNFTTDIASVPGDSYQFIWNMQWWNDALLKEHVTPTFVPQLMYPGGFELAFSEMTPAHTLLGIPTTWLFGAVTSYNLLVFGSYVLSGFFTYLLAQRLGARRSAAFVAGLIFAFTVRRFYQHNAGHLNLMSTQWIPLTLYGWEGLLTRKRRWDGFVAGMGLALTTWATWYYGTTMPPLLMLYALFRQPLRQLPELIGAWQPVVIMSAVTLALVVPVAQPYLEVRMSGVELSHGLIHLEVHSSRPEEYFYPNPYSPFWGTWARQIHRNEGGEHFVAVSYTALLLALAGIGLWWRRERSLVVTLVVVALSTVVLTLGPFLYPPWGGRIALPALFIYEHVPVLNGIRVWNRLVIYVVLCMAMLGALALTALPRRIGRPAAAVSGLLVLIECFSILSHSTPRPRPLDAWLAQQPDQGALIHIPVGPSGIPAFYSLYNGKPINIWNGTFEPPIYSENVGALRSFPSPAALAVLERWGTSYVVVDERALNQLVPDWQARIAELPELSLAYREGGASIYLLEHPGE